MKWYFFSASIPWYLACSSTNRVSFKNLGRSVEVSTNRSGSWMRPPQITSYGSKGACRGTGRCPAQFQAAQSGSDIAFSFSIRLPEEAVPVHGAADIATNHHHAAHHAIQALMTLSVSRKYLPHIFKPSRGKGFVRMQSVCTWSHKLEDNFCTS